MNCRLLARREGLLLVVGIPKGSNRYLPTVHALKDSTRYKTLVIPAAESRFMKRLFILDLIYLLLVPVCSAVYYLPMNSKFTWVLGLARALKKRVIVDYYTSRHMIGTTDRKLGALWPTKRQENELLRCDSVRLTCCTDLICLTRNEFKDFYDWLGLKQPEKQRLHCLPLIISEKNSARTRNKLQIDAVPDAVNFCWWGYASYLHGFDYIFKEISLFLKSHTQANLRTHFYFFDPNVDRLEEMRQMAIRFLDLGQLRSITFSAELTFNTGLSEWLDDHCSFALGPLGFTKQGLSSMANKVVEAWSLGIPVITQSSVPLIESGLQELVLSVDNNSDGCLAGQLNIAYTMVAKKDNALSVMRKAAYSYYCNNYSEAIFRSTLIDIVDRGDSSHV